MKTGKLLTRIRRCGVTASLSAALIAGLPAAASAGPQRPAAAKVCTPSVPLILKSSVGEGEAQAKALNDRGDIVGFADSKDGSGPIHAILWKGGKVAGAVDLGVLPGYVASEAYGVNNKRVVFGAPLRQAGTDVSVPLGSGSHDGAEGAERAAQQADVPDRNAINERGEMAGTLIIAGRGRPCAGHPMARPPCSPPSPGTPGRTPSSINSDGVVSGWSRKMPNDDGEENPVIWDTSGKVVPLQTAPGRADGTAEATNRSGLTVGYLGNLGTDASPGGQYRPRAGQRRGLAVTHGSAAPARAPRSRPRHRRARGRQRPRPGGRHVRHLHEDRIPLSEPRIWRTGWTSLRPLPIPAAAQKSQVVVTHLNDINNRGDIVGNVYGLAGPTTPSCAASTPSLWRCPFAR